MLRFILPLLLVTLPAALRADDAAWLREKDTLIFHDAFEREETGNGAKAIGNGWNSATADSVPKIKMADLDSGILKISSASKEAGHAAHIHHEAGFTDGGAVVRFKFPGLNKGESLQLGFVDRETAGVHAGHLCYGILSQSSVTLIDHKTGIMNLENRKHRDDAIARKEKVPACSPSHQLCAAPCLRGRHVHLVAAELLADAAVQVLSRQPKSLQRSSL